MIDRFLLNCGGQAFLVEQENIIYVLTAFVKFQGAGSSKYHSENQEHTKKRRAQVRYNT